MIEENPTVKGLVAVAGEFGQTPLVETDCWIELVKLTLQHTAADGTASGYFYSSLLQRQQHY